jgi:hypothetical protein
VKIEPTSFRASRQARPPAFASEKLEPETWLSLSGAPGPLRDPAEFGAWQKNYEQELGVGQAARAQALREGGPEMLLRMYPQRYFEDFKGAYSQCWGAPGPTIPLHGDCHLNNFGCLRHRDDELLWSLNDYDQGGSGPPEYDLGRAASSLVLHARQRDWPSAPLLEAFLREYKKGLEQPPGGPLGLSKKEAHGAPKELLKKAAKRGQDELLQEWTKDSKFKLGDKLRSPSPSERQRAQSLLEQAKIHSVSDLAVRLDAGGSSLGLERYWVLSEGRILELKQVLPSALSGRGPAPKNADASQLADSFRNWHAPEDPFQKVLNTDESVFLLRERQRGKDSLKLEKLKSEEFVEVAEQMGQLLGQAHALSGSKVAKWVHSKPDLAESLSNFADCYARQVEEDFKHCISP